MDKMCNEILCLVESENHSGKKQPGIFFKVSVSIFITISLLLSSFFAGAQTSHYIATHKTLATKLSHEYEIPVGIILGVAIIESSAGQTKAARRLHNHFGVVGKNSLHKSGKKSRYKEYKNTAASYYDFCEIISRKSFYAKLKGNMDYKLWIKAISKTGYSENPAVWQKRINEIIVTNHL